MYIYICNINGTPSDLFIKNSHIIVDECLQHTLIDAGTFDTFNILAFFCFEVIFIVSFSV